MLVVISVISVLVYGIYVVFGYVCIGLGYLIASRNPPALLKERALLTLCPCVLALLAFWCMLAVALHISVSRVVLESAKQTVEGVVRNCGPQTFKMVPGRVEHERLRGPKTTPGRVAPSDYELECLLKTTIYHPNC